LAVESYEHVITLRMDELSLTRHLFRPSMPTLNLGISKHI
jgi:hypothetical protein